MTRVNTLNEIADIYFNNNVIEEKAESNTVGKHHTGDE